ncbi:MAG: serine/threonine protein kinase [Hyphomicrobiales bacterium]|nr:MAG: serine/threonine protein kinase [Hyphomicrobiales bacterium]
MLNRHTLPPNTFLDGSYRIERVVGSGGFGITYEAYDVNLGTLVAIKEYFPHDFGDRDNTMSVRPRSEHSKHLFDWGRTNFLSEARTLAGFDHPSIVRVLRVFEAHSTAYMVMRYERGQSFGTWLKELGRKPTQAELDNIIAPLLDALELLHRSNYLHRDIAPDNIIVRPDGTPVLLDFGSARRVIAEMSRMVTGIVKAGYSPHEQYAADNRLQGPWTDIYALGATLYRAVTGRQPMEAMLRFDTDTMETAAALGGPDYRAAFLSAIDACLKVRPSERPQSVADLRQMLQPPVPVTPTVVISRPSPILTAVRDQISVARGVTQRVVDKTRLVAGDTVQSLRFEKLGAWLLGSALVVLLLAGSFAIFQSLKGPEIARSTSGTTTATVDTVGTMTAMPSGADILQQRDDPARVIAEREARRRLAEQAERERLAAEAERKRVAAAEEEKRREAERQRVALLDEQRRQKEAADAERKRQADLEEERRREAEQKRLAALEEQRRQKEAADAERKRLADLEALRRKEDEERKQKALQEEQQRRQQAELERRQQAEREEQRRRDEAERKRLADLEEKRLKAEAEAKRVEAEREKQEAERQRLASVPTADQLGIYVVRIEEQLKKAACFEGLKDGDPEAVQTGLARYSEGLKKYGVQKPALIEVASATTGAIETWLKEAADVRVTACVAPAPRPQVQQRPQAQPQRPAYRPSPGYSAPRGPGTITGIQ